MTEPVTGEELAAICRKEWGADWKSPASRYLGFARRTIYAWAKKPGQPIHKSAWKDVRHLATTAKDTSQ